jgi:hypothetical protein
MKGINLRIPLIFHKVVKKGSLIRIDYSGRQEGQYSAEVANPDLHPGSGIGYLLSSSPMNLVQLEV